MSDTNKHDAWSASDNYEHYMGRWSHKIALEFLGWLDAPRNCDWLEIGCGTGALSRTILDNCAPRSLFAIEPSEGFADHARNTIGDHRAKFEVADAEHLPLPANAVDVTTSALVLNFVSDKRQAFAEMNRVTRPGGVISFYVWNYPSGGVGFIDKFWKAAAEIDEKSIQLDEAARFPDCTSDGLMKLCTDAGFSSVEITNIEIPTVFDTFADFLHPFTLGTGPAPGYYISLDKSQQDKLQNVLRNNVGTAEPIKMMARALAVKAINP